jgi:RNA polymerase sigma factor (sigma-70 family)
MAKDVDGDRYTVPRDSLQAYLRQINTIPVLRREEEIELARRAQAGDQEALERLILSNLRYVVSVARRYLGYGVSLADLINEGNIGLIRAVKRFDPNRGVKLITYAVWWIRQAITNTLADQGGLMALPVKHLEKLRKVLEGYRKDIAAMPSKWAWNRAVKSWRRSSICLPTRWRPFCMPIVTSPSIPRSAKKVGPASSISCPR